ncbi:MAG: MarR family winged helix-turn-helix transcriptional regulator [Pseudomonadota bacterium]
MELERLINEISVKMRLLKIATETKTDGQYSEREILLLELIDANEKMTVSEITEQFNMVAKSIISSTISKFWRAQLVNKDRDFGNQRIIHVSLTPKGKKLLNTIRKNQDERFSFLIKALKLNPEQKKMLEQILENAIKMFGVKK